MKYNYVVKGKVRGEISKHLKLSAAVRSMARDHRICRNMGGGAYSDARVFDLKTRKPVDLEAEGYADWSER
jgi:hypothetical protein